MMKINYFPGDLPDISAKTEALTPTDSVARSEGPGTLVRHKPDPNRMV